MNVKNLDIMDKLLACTTFECLKELQLNDKQLKDTKFKVPHFMIIGWQKCATTSLFRYASCVYISLWFIEGLQGPSGCVFVLLI